MGVACYIDSGTFVVPPPSDVPHFVRILGAATTHWSGRRMYFCMFIFICCSSTYELPVTYIPPPPLSFFLFLSPFFFISFSDSTSLLFHPLLWWHASNDERQISTLRIKHHYKSSRKYPWRDEKLGSEKAWFDMRSRHTFRTFVSLVTR